MTDAALSMPVIKSRWLRSPGFDLVLIVGLPIFATSTGLVALLFPSLFFPILAVDLWFLGYHHVIATYTRLCFDRKSFSQHWPLLVYLLPAVAFATLLMAYLLGIWAVVTTYYYWQWFHYARQSWGISRAYRGKEPGALYENGLVEQAIFYSVPVLGILNRSYQNAHSFIGLDIRMIPVPGVAVNVVGACTVALLLYWAYRRYLAWRESRLAPIHTLYMLSHFAVFFAGYLAFANITYGWLVINIWHNAQYILFVWMFNSRRFKDGVDPQAYFLSYISQPGRLWLYLTWCILITGVIYWGVLRAIDSLFFAGLTATIVLYQIVNFHHYIVDSKIWKVKQEPIRRTLGLEG